MGKSGRSFWVVKQCFFVCCFKLFFLNTLWLYFLNPFCFVVNPGKAVGDILCWRFVAFSKKGATSFHFFCIWGILASLTSQFYVCW